jgi:glycine betaine catabolism B
MKASKFVLELIDKEEIAKDTFTFRFKKPLNFDFIPGQYVKIFLDIDNPDERGSSRYFTISSSPTEDYISITTRIIKSSFKKALSAIKEGDRIKAFGPIGFFDIDFISKKEKVFITGGLGITPFRSILKYCHDKKMKFNATLISAFSNKNNVVFKEELESLKYFFEKINLFFLLTNEEKKYSGFINGKVSKETINKYVHGLPYNVERDDIFSENFPGY